MPFKDKKIRLILSDFDIGAGKKGAAQGPAALRQELKEMGIEFNSWIVLNSNGHHKTEADYQFCKHIDAISEAALKLNNEVIKSVQNAELPLIFSGDHSNAIGGISGLSNANPGKSIGVIWIDAHADLHSPYTTPSGNMHGMPLAALTGSDNLKNKKNELSREEVAAWNRLKSVGSKDMGPKIDSRNIVFIGIRDAEVQEWDLISEKHIKTFEPDDIKEHGIYYALNKGLEHLSHCDLLYVSFDVDSLDPSISTGTGTLAENGLKMNEAEGVFRTLLNHPKLAAFEITEINPGLDGEGRKMASVAASLFNYGYDIA